MKKSVLFLLLLVLALAACVPRPQTARRPAPAAVDRPLADSLLTLALDQEALFTLLSDLKPMSSICMLSFPLARQDSAWTDAATDPVRQAAALRKIERFQRVLATLETEDVGFFLAPFRQDFNGKRTMQLNAYRRSSVARMLAEHPAFFGQWGFAPNADPEVLIQTIEYENKYERFRGYGYLFGYPPHAVDFFVDAARQEGQTKQFVKRDFFNIPVFTGQPGHFVYAVPKDYRPTDVDSTLYRRAGAALDQYRKLRASYVRPDGSLRAYDLWRKMGGRVRYGSFP